MSVTVDGTIFQASADGAIYGKFKDGDAPNGGAAFSLSLTTAGRLGFYIDYSELTDVGTHTFYVCRTHGSAGAVGVSYSTGGDTHTATSGTLSWAAGEMDIKAITVTVPSKSAGDHRMWILLDTPTGGGLLHHGVNTIAYGVIDDDTIATSNAIFIDADAVVNGVGTEASPYDNWYDARDDVIVSTRYIYIKGMMIPDGTDSVAMSITCKHLAIANTFEGRTSEADRIYIRGWPGFTGGIDGGAQTDVTGFAADAAAGAATGDLAYITIGRLSFTDLDMSSDATSGKCYALRTRGGATYSLKEWTAERIIADGINAGQNAAVAVWYTEGGNKAGATEDSGQKMWRWTIDNATHAFHARDLNCYESYRMQNVSIQRCTLETLSGDLYEKEGRNFVGVTGMSARFNLIKGGRIRCESQAGIPAESFHIIQGNVLTDTDTTLFESHPIYLRVTSAATSDADKHWIVGNVFNNFTFSTFGMIANKSDDFTNIIIFNNIFNEIKRPLVIDNGAVNLPEYMDYDVYFRAVGDEAFVLPSASYATVDAFVAGTTFEDNNEQGNPLLEADFSNGSGSSAIGAGVSGTDCGYQLIGNEVVGAA